MFTSRAEHRLLLGCDSVYERLSPIAERLGILDDDRKRLIELRISRMQRAANAAVNTDLTPDRATRARLEATGLDINAQTSVARLMQRPAFDIDTFLDVMAEGEFSESFAPLCDEEREGVINRLRYAGYIERQSREAAKAAADDDVRIPAAMSFALPGLSREVVEKLTFVKPVSVGQASRIPGVTPAAVSILRLHLRRKHERPSARAL